MMTVSDLAFIGDFMPLGFADAMGQRVPREQPRQHDPPREPHEHRSGCSCRRTCSRSPVGTATARAELWAQDGALLGEVSQTVLMRTSARIRDPARPAALLTSGRLG